MFTRIRRDGPHRGGRLVDGPCKWRSSSGGGGNRTREMFPPAGRAMAVARPARDNPWMAPLPTGTVTFMFTDIEGSTTALGSLGAERLGRYSPGSEVASVLLSPRENGSEVECEGDCVLRRRSRARRRGGCSVRCSANLPAAGPSRCVCGWASTPGRPMRRPEVRGPRRPPGAPEYMQRRTRRPGAHVPADARPLGGRGQTSRSRRTSAEGPAPRRSGCSSSRWREFRVFPSALGTARRAASDQSAVQMTPLIGRARELDEVQALPARTCLLTLPARAAPGRRGLRYSAAANCLIARRTGLLRHLSGMRDPA